MKRFVLMLLGKKANKSIDDFTEDLFKSECYYDWIRLKVIGKSEDSSKSNLENLLVESYDEEIKLRQEMMVNGLHVQQGIIALPANEEENENSYNEFLNEINNTNVLFISFINIPSWSQDEKEKMIASVALDKQVNVNELVKIKIEEVINKSSMRLFHTLDHNDFAIICNGEKTKLNEYMKTLEQIRFLRLANDYYIVHDITTIYGYKSKDLIDLDKSNRISAVVSVSGQDITFLDLPSSFRMETIGRYDHLSGYEGITWYQLSEISKKLHQNNVITSRVHVGCNAKTMNTDEEFPTQIPSPLYYRFDSTYKSELSSIDYSKLIEIYHGDEKYVDSIKLMLYEIGFAISITLQRGFSKYNNVCYLEPYMYFIKYIKDKIIGNFDNELEKDEWDKGGAEALVDISNAFYKSILTLDSSIMHSERRFIMSDPHQLTLFDVPPKLIAYYTSIANEMARLLNKDSQNKYVFIVTPDIKKDIYVESITDNRDIGDEINILIIHINERSIYNVTDTTKILAHEIAHHVGQNKELRRERACCFIKCYIARLITECLDHELFSAYIFINDAVLFVEKVVEDIFKLLKDSSLLNEAIQFYYLDELQKNFYDFLTQNVCNIEKINKSLYEILLKHLDDTTLTRFVKKEELFFANLDESLAKDAILKDYVYNQILNTAYENLQDYLCNQKKVTEGMESARFVFKEGYADVQMILLTENLNLNSSEIIYNYSHPFEYVSDKIDETMRQCAVINAFFKDARDIASLSLIQQHKCYDQAYFVYVCKQATSYFTIVKRNNDLHFQERLHNKLFDCSKTSPFKAGEISEIIRQVDNTIASYVESIL